MNRQLMTVRELEKLDKLLTKLQVLLDSQSLLHPYFEVVVNARRVVEQQIQRRAKRPARAIKSGGKS